MVVYCELTSPELLEEENELELFSNMAKESIAMLFYKILTAHENTGKIPTIFIPTNGIYPKHFSY
jgi:hypothetical protein